MIRFPIETERLRIRPFTLEDADALHAVWGDPASERFTVAGGRTPATVEETRSHLENIVRDRAQHGFAISAVIEKSSGKLVGDCGLFVSSDQPEIELAYGFGKAWWGLGYATEAGAACVRAGFEQLMLERIVADVPAGHAASMRVLEKLGFELEREEGGKRYYAVTPSSAP